MVARFVRDEEAAGSNPVISTKKKTPTPAGVFFLFGLSGCTCGVGGPNEVRDEVTEPSAAGGGYSEAEEAKNKEYHERTAK